MGMAKIGSSFLLLFLLSATILPCAVHPHGHGEDRPFRDLKVLLEGSKIGDTVTGLHKLKYYLGRFGYLERSGGWRTDIAAAEEEDEDDHFDDRLESALKLFQTTYHLNASGIVDSPTLDLVMTPRCGVPDLFDGSSEPGIGARWAYLPGSPKWHKRTLTWSRLHPFFPYDFVEWSIKFAMMTWAWQTGFFFEQIPFEDRASADIKVGFFRGGHGDGHSFDGPGGILAHSKAPPRTFIHFDGDEDWGASMLKDDYDFETMVLHELGHTLGMGHSTARDAIMYPKLSRGMQKRNLSQDDIDGIRALYSS